MKTDSVLEVIQANFPAMTDEYSEKVTNIPEYLPRPNMRYTCIDILIISFRIPQYPLFNFYFRIHISITFPNSHNWTRSVNSHFWIPVISSQFLILRN